MAPEEKAQYDQRSIARGSGIIMLGTAALAATCIFGTVFLATGIVILIACIICGIAVMKKAGRESISDRPDIRSCTAVCRDLMLCRDLMSIRKAQLNTMMRTGVPRGNEG